MEDTLSKTSNGWNVPRGLFVEVQEGDSLLLCACPSSQCYRCELRWKCYTSRPLTDLTIREKILLTQSKPYFLCKVPG